MRLITISVLRKNKIDKNVKQNKGRNEIVKVFPNWKLAIS